MKQIPTAKELYLKTLFPTSIENKRDAVELWFETDGHVKENIEVMIEFAKLHVEAALKAACTTLPYDDKMNQSMLDTIAILNSYPLEKIK